MFTFVMIIGLLTSAPPAILNPHGRPPSIVIFLNNIINFQSHCNILQGFDIMNHDSWWISDLIPQKSEKFEFRKKIFTIF